MLGLLDRSTQLSVPVAVMFPRSIDALPPPLGKICAYEENASYHAKYRRGGTASDNSASVMTVTQLSFGRTREGRN